MYSDISILIIFFSVSKSASESAFASSVLPTPVGPIKINEPIGLFSSLRPARALSIASETATTASSWPITLLWRISGSFRSFSLSLSTSFDTGIPVHCDTTSAISSTSTSSFRSLSSLLSARACFSSSSFFSSAGSSPYFSFASVSRSYARSASSMRCFNSSISCFVCLESVIFFFSVSHWVLSDALSLLSSLNSFSNASSLAFDALSVSFRSACFSIWSCIIFLEIWSSSDGMLSISVLIREAASSIKSIALSGRNLSVIYLSDSVAHAIRALSVILTPWWISKRSLSPLKIEIVSLISGWSTITFWNLLSSAASFSMYFLYSVKVVAPMQWSSPLASFGFRRFPASIEPSVFPAPTIVWISSINRMILPSDFSTSFRTALSLSSNSPLNLAPAISAPISRANIVLSFRPSGTSPLRILCASPSTTAVLPTPGSPIKTGLFLVRRDRICIACLISLSLPITGSSLPFLASSTRSWPYFSNAS